MEIRLRNSEVVSLKLVGEGCKEVVVQFSKDGFGNLEVESWCDGHALLFSACVPAEDLAAEPNP